VVVFIPRAAGSLPTSRMGDAPWRATLVGSGWLAEAHEAAIGSG